MTISAVAAIAKSSSADRRGHRAKRKSSRERGSESAREADVRCMELVRGGAGEVRQSEVIAALSHALDMTEGHPVGRPSARA